MSALIVIFAGISTIFGKVDLAILLMLLAIYTEMALVKRKD